jgi:hypothetical protein
LQCSLPFAVPKNAAQVGDSFFIRQTEILAISFFCHHPVSGRIGDPLIVLDF